MKSVWYSLVAGGAIFLAGTAAYAATATSQFNVTLTIANGCGILLTTPVNFGVQNYVATNLTAQGSVTVSCTVGVAYTLGLNGGQSGNVSARQMVNNASAVNYQLYQDAAHQTPWGNTSGSWLSGTGNGLAQIINVYGVVPGPQATVTGNYTDTITVTITY